MRDWVTEDSWSQFSSFATVFRIKSILTGTLHGWTLRVLCVKLFSWPTTAIHGVDRGLLKNCSVRRAVVTTQITWAVGVGRQVGAMYVVPRELGEGIRVNESTN